MAFREKDSSDFDLDTFVDLFDTAMTSNNPAVKKAFKNLLMVASIVHPKEERFDKGPLRRLVEDVQTLTRKVNSLQDDFYRKNPAPPPAPSPLPNAPTWISPNTSGSPPLWPPGTIVASNSELLESK
jgi:hypothetical protein